MLEQLQAWLITAYNHPDFIKIAMLPIIAGFVGWGTNWLAVKMTFLPVEPFGKPPFFGWQGIIPSKMEKMAGIMVDNTIDKLGSLNEFFQEMEPEKISEHVTKFIVDRIEEYTDEVMTEKNAVLWENLPNIVKKRVYSRARRHIPQAMDNLVEDISENIEDLVDLKDMIITQLREDKELIGRVFWEVGEPEFRFVVNSGFYFGFLFGLIQIPVWVLYGQAWTIPVFGLLVGIATNWLALNVIFRPLNPVKVLGFKIHGIFLSRQPEVAESFARITTSEVMTIKHLMSAVMSGPRSHRTKAMIKKHLRPFLEGGVVRTAAQLTVGPGGYANLKKAIEEKALDMSIEPFGDPAFNQERARTIEKLFKERMEAMSSEEFQDLLRPAFQEDEWILILVGGILGGIAGLCQMVFVFGLSL